MPGACEMRVRCVWDAAMHVARGAEERKRAEGRKEGVTYRNQLRPVRGGRRATRAAAVHSTQ